MVKHGYQRTALSLKSFFVISFILGYFATYPASKEAKALTSISIESERATYQQHKTPHPHLVCIHEGNVHVTLSNGAHAHTDTLEALIRETPREKKQGMRDALKTITLKRNVTITYQDHTVRGDEALIDASSQQCTVTGNVKITKHEAKGNTIVTQAKSATLDLTTNSVTLEGSPEKPVHTLIHVPPPHNPHKRVPRKAP